MKLSDDAEQKLKDVLHEILDVPTNQFNIEEVDAEKITFCRGYHERSDECDIEKISLKEIGKTSKFKHKKRGTIYDVIGTGVFSRHRGESFKDEQKIAIRFEPNKEERYISSIDALANYTQWVYPTALNSSIVTFGTLQFSEGSGLSHGSLMTIYQGEDKRIWVRPTHEFFDGRFEPVIEENNFPFPGEFEKTIPLEYEMQTQVTDIDDSNISDDIENMNRTGIGLLGASLSGHPTIQTLEAKRLLTIEQRILQIEERLDEVENKKCSSEDNQEQSPKESKIHVTEYDPDYDLMRKICEILIFVYSRDPTGIAKICDGNLDKSGNLLGYIRSLTLMKDLEKAKQWWDTASDEEKEDMFEAQKKNYAKGAHGPTDGMGTRYLHPTEHVYYLRYPCGHEVNLHFGDVNSVPKTCRACQNSRYPLGTTTS